MYKLLFVMSMLLGSVTQVLQAQNTPSFGLRLGNFNSQYWRQQSEGQGPTRLDGGLGAQLVRDWARGESGFIRGRLGLSLNATKETFVGTPNYANELAFGASVALGRGRTVKLGSFAFHFGGEGELGVAPYSQRYAYSVSPNSAALRESFQTVAQQSLRASAGAFLQLDWNIHRNIWIGVEQRSLFSLAFVREKQREDFSSTPLSGGTTTTLIEESTSNYLAFSHPFDFPTPMFSITFRPGGK
jgi:hypothetical protein